MDTQTNNNPPLSPLTKGGKSQATRDKKQATDYYLPESQLDKQGKYCYALIMKAGWTKKQFVSLLLTKYKKMHWNTLDKKEKSQIITIMKKYAEKNETKQGKALRQKIHSVWLGNGHTKEELKDYMKSWGFGESTRACKLQDLQTIYRFVLEMTKK